MSDVSDAISERAQGPKRVSVDGTTVEEHSLKDQIEADRHLESGTGARAPNFGIRYGRFRHQGTV